MRCEEVATLSLLSGCLHEQVCFFLRVLEIACWWAWTCGWEIDVCLVVQCMDWGRSWLRANAYSWRIVSRRADLRILVLQSMIGMWPGSMFTSKSFFLYTRITIIIEWPSTACRSGQKAAIGASDPSRPHHLFQLGEATHSPPHNLRKPSPRTIKIILHEWLNLGKLAEAWEQVRQGSNRWRTWSRPPSLSSV